MVTIQNHSTRYFRTVMPCSVALRRRNVGLQEYRHAAEGVHGDAKAAEQGLHRYGALLSQLPPTVSICSRYIRGMPWQVTSTSTCR